MNEDQLNEQTEQEQVRSAREARRQELIGMFNPVRMKVIRKELFPSPRDPAVTIRDGNISFNAACIKSLEGVVYVNLYLDEELGLFSVSGCDENDKQALCWCVAKGGEKRTSRRMRCPDFTDFLYDLMGWDKKCRYKKCRYKALGYLIPYNGRTYYVFDLNNKQTFNEKPKKGEEPLDENGEPIPVDTRKGYFSDDIEYCDADWPAKAGGNEGAYSGNAGGEPGEPREPRNRELRRREPRRTDGTPAGAHRGRCGRSAAELRY